MNSVEPSIIPVPGISTASTDNKLRPEIQGFLLQLVIINEPSLLASPIARIETPAFSQV